MCGGYDSPTASAPQNIECRLPRYIRPARYQVHLTPNLVDFTFKGSVKISIDIGDVKDHAEEVAPESVIPFKPNQLILHAAELEIQSATLSYVKSYSPMEECGDFEDAKNIHVDETTELVTFTFDEDLKLSSKVVLVVQFTGILNDGMHGFYRSSYDLAGKKHHMGVTQFEAVDARRSLPCFDEPSFKAVFDVAITAPENFTVLSNMPIFSTCSSSASSENQQLTTRVFESSPIMSTYLLAYVVGEHLEYVEKKITLALATTEERDSSTLSSSSSPSTSSPTTSAPLQHFSSREVTVRVYTTKGKSAQAAFALEIACKSVALFEQWFGIEYPLPKLDLIAVPDFSAGAMENFGLITFRGT